MKWNEWNRKKQIIKNRIDIYTIMNSQLIQLKPFMNNFN